ncbi:MAG: DUF1896 family protein [Paludibacteraceae bacterium]
MKTKNKPQELSYYKLYLLSYLGDNHPNLLSDTDFIEERADLATDTYEQARLDGYTLEGAQELAMDILLQGLHFSRFNTIVEVLWNEFESEIPQEHATEFACKILSSLEPIFSKYPISDNFAYTGDYSVLYSELTGAILLYMEEYGI